MQASRTTRDLKWEHRYLGFVYDDYNDGDNKGNYANDGNNNTNDGQIFKVKEKNLCLKIFSIDVDDNGNKKANVVMMTMISP